MTTAGFNPNPTGSNTTGLITSSTPAPMVGPVLDEKKRPTTTATFRTSSKQELFAQYRNMSPQERKNLAAKLKAAGFRVPVTGAYNEKVRSAFYDANAALNDEIKLLSESDPARLAQVPYDLNSYLSNIAGSGTGTGKTPTTYESTTITNKTSAAKTLDAIAANLLGRQLSPEEKAKYTAMLTEAQKAAPTVSTYVPNAGGLTKATTTGGLDTEQFLIEKLAATDEAKAQKVLNAYQAVNKLFGGLQ